jgi:hypothetical protein
VPHMWPFSPSFIVVGSFLDRSSLEETFEVVTICYGGTLASLDPTLAIFEWDILSLGRILYMWHNYFNILGIFDLVLVTPPCLGVTRGDHVS